MILPKKYVLVIGSSNIDLNISSERFPTPGETVTGGIFYKSYGGKGANQAVAARRSGSNTVFVGKIGTDSFGDQMLKNLSNEGINIDYVIQDPKNASGVAVIFIDSSGQNMISVASGANKYLTTQEIDNIKDLIQNATCILVQMELSMEVIEKIFNIATNWSSTKILNPAPFKEIPTNLLEKIDIITPNENELMKLHSSLGFDEIEDLTMENMKQMMRDIHKSGIRIIITTLGKNGCLISDKTTNKQYHVPAIEVEAIDTVGAGDCFNGVLAGKLCLGESLHEAVKYANIAASIAVTRKGAQKSIPCASDIH
ncbi:MAG: ribokinase [Candidatus Hodarchaeales archaeon]